MNITIIGTGFVGVVSAAVFASLGNQIIGLDVDEKKVASLKKGKVPFFEPDLERLLLEQQAAGNLTFTTNYAEAITKAEIIMIAVGTPSAADGQADLKYVFASIDSAAPYIQPETIIVVKSTVPPGTLDVIAERLNDKVKVPYYLASLPEYLREGSAVYDTLHPDRVVIGATEQHVQDKLEELHKPLGAPILKMKPVSAQMAKYAANAYLANRILFINQIADLCEQNGADVEQVIDAIGYDKRIGSHYWYPGFGYGGSCFPKDVSELAAYSRSIGLGDNLFNSMTQLNKQRIPMLMDRYAEQVKGWENRTVAVLGLAFKPNTDDMREAPSIKTIEYLVKHGAKVRGYDPQALETVPYFIPEHENISYFDTIEEAVAGAEVIMVLIEWPQIIEFDFGKSRNKLEEQWLIDARNQFDPKQVEAWGYNYIGIGR